MSIEIRIAGPNAQALAAEVEAFVLDGLGERPERRTLAADGTARRGDPLAVAALVLAIPGAILATLDLAGRARLAERVGRLLERLRATAGPEDAVGLHTPAKPDLDLTTADRDAVLDRLDGPPGGT